MLQCHYEIHVCKNDTFSVDKPHFHEDIELTLCVAGSGEFYLGPEVYPLQRGQLFLIDRSVLHRSSASEDYRCIAFHIFPETLAQFSTPHTDFLGVLPNCSHATVITEEQTCELESYYQRLSAYCSDDFGDDMRQTLVVMEFLLTCFSHLLHVTPNVGISNPALNKVSPILKYIQEHLDEPLTIGDIAKTFYMSKYYLCHIFKEGTGFSVMDYVINCRILRARALLRQGVRVAESGERAGFRSNEHFIRTFKKLTGMTPKHYSMMYRKADQNMKQDVVSVESINGSLVQSTRV